LNTQKIAIVEIAIRRSTMTQVQQEWPMNHPNWIFIPKKLAMRVGGISIRDTRVNTFIILF
jgi:hypothetical protein